MSIQPKSDTQTINSSGSQRIARYLLALPRSGKRAILLLADFIMAVVSLYFAIAVRYGYMGNHISVPALFAYALVPVIGLYIIGFYKGVARSFFDAMMGKVLQLFFVLIVLAQAVLYFQLIPTVPRAVPILFLFLYFIWLWSSRLTIKELLARWQGQRQSRHDRKDYDNVLIYGAGEAGKELLEGLKNSHKYDVVAFVDDDIRLKGAYVLGKRIYAANELIKLVADLDIAQVFLAIPSISRARNDKSSMS